MLPAGEVTLVADLEVPAHARGLVIFAHGSGSGRHSPRNRAVAALLWQRGIGTLLVDLHTDEESRRDAVDAHFRIDVQLLAHRLEQATRWTRSAPETRDLPLGYFGSSTGAAAALVAAAARKDDVEAVVSRGGRPDLAKGALERVSAPTLFIVGSADPIVLELNRRALGQMRARAELAVVPGASHLFEEPGTLTMAAHLAGAWFERYLGQVESVARDRDLGPGDDEEPRFEAGEEGRAP